MPQFQAGYFLEAIIRDFTSGLYSDIVKGMLNFLSYFDLETRENLEISHKPDPIAVVVNNIISRGLPTVASTFVEDLMATTFLKTKKKQDTFGFHYEFVNDELHEDILRALFVIDPRLKLPDLKKIFPISDQDPEKEIKKQFLFEFIPVEIGEYFLQLLSVNRPVKSVIENSPLKYRINPDLFDDVPDYSVENPFVENNVKGILIDTKKKDYLEDIDYLKEDQKRALLERIKWKGILRLDDLSKDSQAAQEILSFTFSKYFDFLRKNFTTPLYTSDTGLDALQLALTPLEIARIEKAILALVLAGKLSLNDKKWKIAIIERDIPGAFIALQDLKQFFNYLFHLEGKGRKFPEIDLTVFYTPEFENAELNLLYMGNKALLDEFNPKEEYDLLIDSSVLRRSGLDPNDDVETNAKISLKIRTPKFIYSVRRFPTTAPVKYDINIENGDKAKQEQTKSALSFFLKTIFRKNSLTHQQLTVVAKTLSLENTLAVLPFKASKSLLYQFSAILQPGLSVIITPIDALMNDQVDSLKNHFIDAISYFSPATIDIYERYKALTKLKNAQSIYNFIDADRFHLFEVRQTFNQLKDNNIKLAYFVVDEAHCISEWSHDFRSVYGTLASNIKNIYSAENQTPVLCLTSTASYDVTKEIAHQFEIRRENIFQLENDFSRFNFKFVKIKFEPESKNINDIVQSLEKKKQLQLINYVKGQKKALVYHPNPIEFKNALKSVSPEENIEHFSGSFWEKGMIISAITANTSFKNYKLFKNNLIDILVARPSFAIGLNKPDIRKVYFLNIPETVEGFIQMINRAGRDLKNTDVYLFYSPTEVETRLQKFEFTETGTIEEKIITTKSYAENILRLQNLKRLYLNPKKEFSIVNELLQEITYPSEKIQDILIRRIKYQFDLWTTFVPQPMVNPNMLYVYDDEHDSLGYIDFAQDKIVLEAPIGKKQVAEKVLNFLKYDIEKIVANGMEIFDLLDEEIKNSPYPGIARILPNMKTGDQRSITIEFYNNSPSKLLKLIKKNLQVNLTFNEIIDAYETSADFEIFNRKILNKIGKPIENFPKIKEEIRELFCKFRNFHDTLFGLYRLKNIGIIDDFIIDYHNQQFTVIFTKKTDTEIINNVYEKILQFVTKRKALEVYEKIPKTVGSTLIVKAVNYYISFVHNFIYKKHYNSFMTLWEILDSNQERPKRLKALLFNFFTAKYIPDLENNLNSGFEFVKDMMNKMEFYLDNFHHLYTASKLLLNTYPNNNNLLIINGLAGMVLHGENKKALTEDVNLVAEGINNMRFENPQADISETISWIFDFVSKHNMELKSIIEPVFMLKIHLSWLQDFNAKLRKLLKIKK